MGRKNRRVVDDLYLPPIKEDRRSMPRCSRFPGKTVFTTGYRAQTAVDEIQARSDRDKTPVRVYTCETAEGGCGYFHITSQQGYLEDHNEHAIGYPDLGSADYLDDRYRYSHLYQGYDDAGQGRDYPERIDY